MGNEIVLLKFGATWCAPCKMIAPTLKTIKEEYDYVSITEIDVDDEPDVAKKYKIKHVPTVILFINGEEVDRITGMFKIDALRSMISNLRKEENNGKNQEYRDAV
jgi:thioredoxin 1